MKQKKRIEFLDFAKGFAMAIIVLFHYFQNSFQGILNNIVIFGGSGVHLFIFLSGFGLGLSSQKLSVTSFYMKRFSKLLIPYYLFVIIIFIINIFVSIYPGEGFYALLGHIFLFKMFDENIIGSFGFHLWFMSAIIQLYLFFPLLIKIKNQFTIHIFIIISFLVSLIYWILLIAFDLDKFIIFSNSGLQFLWEFCLGIVLADYYLYKGFKFENIKMYTLLICMLIGISLTGFLAIYGGRTGKTLNDVPALLGYTSLVMFLYYYIIPHFKQLKKIISLIGQKSLELYLIHMVILYLISSILSSVFSISAENIGIRLFIIFPIAIFSAFLFSFFNKKLLKAFAES